jgi:hypothetical protein
MKSTAFWNAILFASSLAFGQNSAFAIGPEESTCSDAIEVPCPSKDPNVLAFRKQQINQLYNELIYPGPREVLKDPNNASHIFQTGSIKGRVTPVGKFTDFAGVVEYFYALAMNPKGHVTSVSMKVLLADEDKVHVTVDLGFCNIGQDCSKQTEKEKKRALLTETGIFQFNKQNKVIFFDLIIPNLGLSADIPENQKLEREKQIAGICAFLTIGHVDPITEKEVKGGTCTSFFDSQNDFGKGFIAVPNAPFLNCMTFMHSIPFGSYNRANSNTFTCRSLHALLTPLRPDVHCAHVGFTGGGKCVDFPYESYYDDFNSSDRNGHDGHR